MNKKLVISLSIFLSLLFVVVILLLGKKLYQNNHELDWYKISGFDDKEIVSAIGNTNVKFSYPDPGFINKQKFYLEKQDISTTTSQMVFKPEDIFSELKNPGNNIPDLQNYCSIPGFNLSVLPVKPSIKSLKEFMADDIKDLSQDNDEVRYIKQYGNFQNVNGKDVFVYHSFADKQLNNAFIWLNDKVVMVSVSGWSGCGYPTDNQKMYEPVLASIQAASDRAWFTVWDLVQQITYLNK